MLCALQQFDSFCARFFLLGCRDPLVPNYSIHGMYVRDDPYRLVPVSQKPRNAPLNSLVTADIDGAVPLTALTAKIGSVAHGTRKSFLRSNRLDDIEGSHPGSRVIGLRTVRGTDPNEREYPQLDGREMEADELAIGHGWYTAATALIEREVVAQSGALGRSRSSVSAAASLPPQFAYARKLLDPRDATEARARGERTATRLENTSRAPSPLRSFATTTSRPQPVTWFGDGSQKPSTSLPAEIPVTPMRSAGSAIVKVTSARASTAPALAPSSSEPMIAKTAISATTSMAPRAYAPGSKELPPEPKFSSGTFTFTKRANDVASSSTRAAPPRADNFASRTVARDYASDISAVRSLPS